MKLSPAKSKSRTLYLTVFSGLNTLPALASLSFDALASPLSSPTPPPRPAFPSPLALPCHFAGRRHTAERFKYHTLKEVMKNQGKSHQKLCSGPKLVQQAPAQAGARAVGLVHPDLLVLQGLVSEDLSVTRSVQAHHQECPPELLGQHRATGREKISQELKESDSTYGEGAMQTVSLRFFPLIRTL